MIEDPNTGESERSTHANSHTESQTLEFGPILFELELP